MGSIMQLRLTTHFNRIPHCRQFLKPLHRSSAIRYFTMSRADAEKHIQRNPHPDFKKVEADRQPWDKSMAWNIKQTIKPDWKYGDGANDGGAGLRIPHVEIDPYETGRPAVFNCKLLISGIIPRPIGFISTRSRDGSSTNLAPFSYFSLSDAGGFDNAKDSLKNLSETQEC